MVLKTISDRPVRLPTGHSSGPVRPIGPGSHRTGIEPFEPTIRSANRMNRSVPSGPNNSFSFLLPYATGTPTVTWSVIWSATIPPLLPGASSADSTPSARNPAHLFHHSLKSPPNLGSTQRKSRHPTPSGGLENSSSSVEPPKRLVSRSNPQNG